MLQHPTHAQHADGTAEVLHANPAALELHAVVGPAPHPACSV